MGFFDGRRVFLAGGSEGIGRCTAVALAKGGAHVVVAARRQAPLDEVVEAMRAAAPNGRFGSVSVDVTDAEAVRRVVSGVDEQLGGPTDLLITNVGMALTGYVDQLPDEAFQRMLQVNYLGHVHVVRAFLPSLRAAGRGDVCLVSSALGFMSTPGYSAYSASKYAVAGFAESLRMELRPQNIRVTLFYPGTTDTPGLKSENETKPKAVWAMESDSAFSKTHQPEAVADTLLRSIERGSFENFPGFDVSLIWWMYQHFPTLSRWMADKEWDAAMKKVGGAV